MVVRRKYRARPDPPDQTNVGVVPAQGPPAAPGPATDADGASPFQRAHEALQHAEALQQQHRHRQQIGLAEPARSEAELRAIDQFVESIPNISDHQRRFLRSHPTLMTSPYDELMGHAITVAKHAGIAPDTAAMDHAILSGVARDIEHHHHLSQLASPLARPTPQNAVMPADVEQPDLQAEAEQHLAAHQPAPTALPPSSKRRSMPMSAPVSRAFVSVSGRPAQDNHLTAEERVIARNSFGDPNMSNQEKELLYLRNRNKYRAAKADGSYSSQGDR